MAVTATLTWLPNPESDLAGYEIFRALGSSPATQLISVGKVVTYVDLTLPAVDQNVTYSIRAFDTAGNRGPFGIPKTVAVNAVPPSAPLGLDVVLS